MASFNLSDSITGNLVDAQLPRIMIFIYLNQLSNTPFVFGAAECSITGINTATCTYTQASSRRDYKIKAISNNVNWVIESMKVNILSAPERTVLSKTCNSNPCELSYYHRIGLEYKIEVKVKKISYLRFLNFI